MTNDVVSLSVLKSVDNQINSQIRIFSLLLSKVLFVVMHKILIFIPIFVLLSLDLVQGLRCYTCSYDENDKGSSVLCVTEPWNLTGNPIRTCLPHFKYCIIIRVESKPTGRVTSFLRKCEENPAPDSDEDSMAVSSHYRSCQTDLCNKGDGLNYVDEGHEEECPAILVPDRDSVAAVSPATCLILVSMVLSLEFLNR